MQALEIRPFLGPIRIGREDQCIVPEALFEENRGALAKEYMKRREMIAGGFSIRYYGEERFGPEYWDDVVPLMRYIRTALQTLKQGAPIASFDLPDQPVTITLDRNGRRQLGSP